MLVPLLLALPLLAQAPPLVEVVPPPLRQVGDRVTLPAGTSVAANLATLTELLELASDPRLGELTQRARYGAMLRSTRVLELAGQTRVEILGVAPEERYRDGAGRPVRAYRAVAQGGPLNGRTLFVYSFQADHEPLPTRRPLSPAEVAQADAAAEMRAERDRTIYPAYVRAIKAARAHAAQANPAVRGSVLRHGLEEVPGRIIKEFRLGPDDLDEIVARGEAADGTVTRRAEKSVHERAKASNDAALMMIDVAVNRGINRAVAESRWTLYAPRVHTFNPLGPGGTFPGGTRTNTITHDTNYRPLGGR